MRLLISVMLFFSACAHRAGAWIPERREGGGAVQLEGDGTLEPTSDALAALKAAGWARVGWSYASSTGDSDQEVCTAALERVRANGGGRVLLHDATRTSESSVSGGSVGFSFGQSSWYASPSVSGSGSSWSRSVTHRRCIAEVFRRSPELAASQPDEPRTYPAWLATAKPCAAARAKNVPCSLGEPEPLPAEAPALEACCGAGNGRCCLLRGHQHFHASEPDEAKRWYRRGCELGAANACSALANEMTINGWVNLPEAERAAYRARARALVDRACESGLVGECWNAEPAVAGRVALALCEAGELDQCATAAGNLPDLDRGTRLYATSCASGDGRACLDLGYRLKLPPAEELPLVVRACVFGLEDACERLDRVLPAP